LVVLRLGVECPDARLYSDESVRAVDVRFDIGKAQRLAGGGEHRCSIWQEGSYTSAGRLRIVENFDAECMGGECVGGAIDLFGSSRHGELLLQLVHRAQECWYGHQAPVWDHDRLPAWAKLPSWYPIWRNFNRKRWAALQGSSASTICLRT